MDAYPDGKSVYHVQALQCIQKIDSTEIRRNQNSITININYDNLQLVTHLLQLHHMHN